MPISNLSGATTFDEIRTLQGAALRTALQRFYLGLYEHPDLILDYLADTCVQHVGLKTLDCPEIIAHVKHIRTSAKLIEYHVTDAIAYADRIADRHRVDVTLHDGRAVSLEVFCFLRFANRKIVEIFECSQVLEGDRALSVLATATG